LEPFFIYKLN